MTTNAADNQRPSDSQQPSSASSKNPQLISRLVHPLVMAKTSTAYLSSVPQLGHTWGLRITQFLIPKPPVPQKPCNFMGTSSHFGHRYTVSIFLVISIIPNAKRQNPVRPIIQVFIDDFLSRSPTRIIRTAPAARVGILIFIEEINSLLRAWNTSLTFSSKEFISHGHNDGAQGPKCR